MSNIDKKSENSPKSLESIIGSDKLLQQNSNKQKSQIYNMPLIDNMAWKIISSITASAILGFIGGTIAIQVEKSNIKQAIPDAESTSQNTYNVISSNSQNNSQPNLSLSSISETAIKSIIEITTDKPVKQYSSSSVSGSGIIISQDGYILTCTNIISGANKIWVSIDGEKVEASIAGNDKDLNISLLKVEKSNLIPAVFGDSSELKISQDVIAVGNSTGNNGGIVTKGIISVLNRDITVNNQTINVIQTDAAISSGIVGGGLFNKAGELIGLIYPKPKSASYEGIGFVIPINNLEKSISDLKNFGRIRGKIDIEMEIIDSTTAQSSDIYQNYSKGVLITDVPENSNAQVAGFQTGDCIISINSEEVSNISSLNSILKNYNAGDTVSVDIMRKEESITLNLQLSEMK